MTRQSTRRTFVKAVGASAAGAALLGSATPAAAGENYAPSDKDAVVGAPRGTGAAAVSINQYPSTTGNNWQGTVIEEAVGHRHDIPVMQDLHVLLWDSDYRETVDVRNDAVSSTLSYANPRLPEAQLTNEFQIASGYRATLTQDVLSSANRDALAVRNRAQFDEATGHGLYTLVNVEIDDYDSQGAGDEAYLTSANGYDVMVGYDGANYLAYAQRRPATGQTTFDGQRVGVEGTTSGSDESAWHDVYVENDGWIDSNTANAGNVDTVVGMWVDTATDVTWETAVGFGSTSSEAVSNATATLDAGYASERSDFVTAWDDYHAGVRSSPLSDATANAMYERSLSAVEASTDPTGPGIAGLFEPHGDQYTYVWPRDQVIMIQALLAADATDAALAALSWLDGAQIKTTTYHDTPTGETLDRKGTWWQNYFVDGTRNWVMLQLDQVGGPIYAHWLAWQEIDSGASGSSILSDHYAASKLAAEFLLGYDNGYGFPKKHNDPWEENWGYTTEGTAAAIAGLRCMAAMADAEGDTTFADDCRSQADTWESNLATYCYKTNAYLGDHFVTCDKPEWDSTPSGEPAPDQRPDAAAFMTYWPWNVVSANSTELNSTVQAADDTEWTANNTPCLDRYPGDDYTPSDSPEDGGWPLTEAYADVARQATGHDTSAVADYVRDHAEQWQTAAGLLPERVDGNGAVRWNSHLNWSQAMFVLLAEQERRGQPFGFAPSQ
jgi:GH15 family glucan-1,4-alpha-glucosidase